LSSNTKIEDIIQREFKAIKPYDGIVSVKEQLFKDSFCVVLDRDSFLGILTPADIVKSPYSLVIDCLHHKPHVDYDQEIVSILDFMIKSHVYVAPVFRKNEFIGVICQEYIINYFLENPVGLEQKITKLGRIGKVKRELKKEAKHFIDVPLQEIKKKEKKESDARIGIFLASRDRIYRTTLCNMLEKEPDIEITGESADAEILVDLVKDCVPDIILFDCKFTASKFSDFIQSISSVCPTARIIVLARCSNKRCIKGMIRAGIYSCLLEDYHFRELVHAIHMVEKNVKYFPAGAREIVDTIFSDGLDSSDSSILILTNREREVLKLLSEGNSTKEIANTLCVCTKTVETHRLKIMKKLKIHTVAGLTKYAIREGLIDL